jgi:hypothetical protein
MRCAIGLLLFLGGLIWCAARIDVSESSFAPQRIVESPWRRTTDGWQRADRWPGATTSTESMGLLLSDFTLGRASLPHPAIVALLLLLPSLLFLLAFSPPAPKEPRTE